MNNREMCVSVACGGICVYPKVVKPVRRKPAAMPKRIELTLLCGRCGRSQKGKILITKHGDNRLKAMVAETEPCECCRS